MFILFTCTRQCAFVKQLVNSACAKLHKLKLFLIVRSLSQITFNFDKLKNCVHPRDKVVDKGRGIRTIEFEK